MFLGWKLPARPHPSPLLPLEGVAPPPSQEHRQHRQGRDFLPDQADGGRAERKVQALPALLRPRAGLVHVPGGRLLPAPGLPPQPVGLDLREARHPVLHLPGHLRELAWVPLHLLRHEGSSF